MRPDNPDGTSIPFLNTSTGLLSLGINDIYRLITTTISFCILFPYSMYSLAIQRNYSLTIILHLIAAALYTIDLIRMKSHPHCWFFNCPFILWYIIDRLYGIYSYRVCNAQVVKKLVFNDNSYMILFLKISNKLKNKKNIGDVFYFNFKNCYMKFEKSHPFTCFQNHNESSNLPDSDHIESYYSKLHKFYLTINNQLIRTETKNELSSSDVVKLINEQNTNKFEWDVGVIIQIFDQHDNCFDKRNPWTFKLAKEINVFDKIKCWGPYRSEYKRLYVKKSIDIPIVLIGTGAGIAYVIDCYYHFVNNSIQLNASVYFYISTRSLPLFQWFADITCAKQIKNLQVHCHLTGTKIR